MRSTLPIALLALLAASCKPKEAPKTGTAVPAGTPAATAPKDAPDLPQGEKTYYFGSADRHTTIQFEARSSVGNIVGSTRKISGSATIDFGTGTGKTHVTVPVASMTTGVTPIDNAMKMKQWMDAEGFPTLEFKAENTGYLEKPRTWKIEGQWTMRGVSRDLTLEATVIPIPPDLARKAALGEGDWVRVKTKYQVKLSDHGVQIPEGSVYTVDDLWTVTVDIFGTTAKPAEAGVVKANPEDDGLPQIIRPEKIEPVEGDGKLYKFGKKPQFTNIVAESVTDVQTVIAQSKILGGYLRVDLEKGSGRMKVSVPVKSLKTGIDERDKLFQGPDFLDMEKCPHLRFESTEASRKDDKTWAVKGALELRGVSKPVACEAAMRQVTAEQMVGAKWGTKEALGFTTTIKIKLSDYGIKVPEGMNDEWTLKIDLLAEAEE